jgi:molybdopterin-synthase adenylyltransferase
MIELVIPLPFLEKVLPSMLGEDREGCAVLFTRTVGKGGSLSRQSTRLLAFDYIIPGPEVYQRRGAVEAQLSPGFVADVTKKAKIQGCGLVFAHSHPGDSAPKFSALDDEGESQLAPFLRHRVPNATHVAFVVSRGGAAARVLGTDNPVRVVETGRRHRVLFDGMGGEDQRLEYVRHDRQVRAFGSVGQQRLSQLTIGIVGLGGTGSIVAQQLAHLGVMRFLLIDPDKVEITNLNRLANAFPSDVGKQKTDVARRYIQMVSQDAQVEVVDGDVTRVSVAAHLKSVDIIFGCTDSHGSRAVLQQIAYQYLIPCIDMGTTIVAENGEITHIHGRVQLLAPGLPCLTCCHLLDANEVRQDMMTEFERKADPYIVGAREPAPSVMSLNATVASLAVTMLLSIVTEMGGKSRHLIYNAITSSLRTIAHEAHPECFVCSSSGVFARGDSAPLMARQD